MEFQRTLQTSNNIVGIHIYIHKYIFAQTVRKIKLCAEEK